MRHQNLTAEERQENLIPLAERRAEWERSHHPSDLDRPDSL